MSKKLSFLLRHDTEYAFDEHGWRTVDDLVTNQGFTMDELTNIVATDNKGRYEFNDNWTLIRARQGHSVDVDVELEEKTPPAELYHGTATRFIESIRNEGIKKMSRNYVQLSASIETATDVGRRHGSPVVLVIDTKAMAEDGIIFRYSRNNVWLVDHVDVKYIKNL